MRKSTFEVSDIEMLLGRNPTGSREDWVAFGNRVKKIESEIQSLLLDPIIRGKKRGRSAAIIRVLYAMLQCKSFFDSQICCEYLEWPESTKVFYGPQIRLRV